MIQKKKNILRLTISLLLVLCLLPFDAAYELTIVQHPEKYPKTVLLIPDLMGCATGPAVLNQRPDFISFEELLKNALIIERTSIKLTRVYVFFLTELSIRFVQYRGQTITIRAPPCFKP